MSVDVLALANEVAETEDFTKVETGKVFEKELPAAGVCVLRFREYIELGMHPTASKEYPNKKPQKKARFLFEILTPRHVKDVEVGEGAEKKTIKIAPHIYIECPISKSEKSNYIKLFKLLNWEQKATHPAQLLGSPYMAEIVHAWAKGESAEKGHKPSYANLIKDGVFTIGAPRKVDALTGEIEMLNVPALINPLKIFLWEKPTKECWDSLFIEGTYEKDGEQKSKNFVQEMILKALNFEGSPLQALLLSEDGQGLGDLPTSNEEIAQGQQAPPPSDSDDPLAGIV